MGKRRRGDACSRTKVESTVEGHKDAMNEKGEEIEKTTCDVEVESQTLSDLKMGGTTEGADAVEQSIESAQETSVGEFEEQSGELEQVHGEVEEYEGELNERSDTTSSDMDKISEATGQINSDAPKGELDAARDAAQEDIDFLDENEKNDQDARAESQSLHDEYEGRVNSARSS